MTIAEMIAGIQAKLGLIQDGKAGPQTWGAIYRAIVRGEPSEPPAASDISTVDPRSERSIQTLNPRVRSLARALIQAAAEHGIAIRAISGTRTDAEQDALYAKGRTAPGSIITNARAGFSNHNFGIAFDIGIFEGSKYIEESPAYKAVGVLGVALGLDWGGGWKTIQDEPHFQLRPFWAAGLSEGAMLAGLRERKAQGRDLFD